MRGKNIVSAVMGRILMIGFGVQILLGMVWMFCHIGYYQEFPDSAFLERVAGSLVCDEYTGILYPLLILLCQGITRVVPIPYFCVLYGLQLVAAGAAAWCFLKGLEPFQRSNPICRVWAMLSILTLPMAMQCHLAVLPVSLASSLFLLQGGIYLQSQHTSLMKPILTLTKLGIVGLIAGLLLPEYRFFGLILPLCHAIGEILKASTPTGRGRKILQIALVTAAFMGVSSLLAELLTVQGAYGRMQNTVEAAAFRRFAWDDFGEFYSEWPQELRDALTQEEIQIGNSYPIEKEMVLGEKVDAVYGREEARKIYGQVQAITARVRFARNCKEILKDFVCHVLAPPTQLMLMEGRGQVTLSGRNLDIMRAHMPKLTMCYVRYGYAWFTAAGIISALLGLFGFGKLTADNKKSRIKTSCVFALISIVISLWYTMQGGGIMDYKNSLPVTLLWGLWMCHTALVFVIVRDGTADAGR